MPSSDLILPLSPSLVLQDAELSRTRPQTRAGSAEASGFPTCLSLPDQL